MKVLAMFPLALICEGVGSDTAGTDARNLRSLDLCFRALLTPNNPKSESTTYGS